MKVLKILIMNIICNTLCVNAQHKEIHQINTELDNEPYYNISINYSLDIQVPDSTKNKVLSSLKGIIPLKVIDSIYALSPKLKKVDIERCKVLYTSGDNKCLDSLKQVYVHDLTKEERLSKSLILAVGSWGIKNAIPILQRGINSNKYPQLETEMALAKLSVEPYRKKLKEECSLSYVQTHTRLSFNNSNNVYKGEESYLTINLLQRFYSVGMYLDEISILINMVDLLDIRGREYFQSEEYIACQIIVLMEMQSLFKKNMNYSQWSNLTNRYFTELATSSPQEFEKKISSPYQENMKKELKYWITENVKFKQE